MSTHNTADRQKEPQSLQRKQAPESTSSGRQMAPPPFQLKASGEPPAPIQKKEAGGSGNLPGNLVFGFQGMTGHDLSDVNVHYNSEKPAALGAHAYAQGNDIHLGAGQEKHLAHETAHIVQQREGRVKPTTEVGGMGVNDNPGLESEADQMGAKALQMKADPSASIGTETKSGSPSNVVQRRAILPEETTALTKLNQLADATQEEWSNGENMGSIYEGMPGDMRALKTSLESQISSVDEREIQYKGSTYTHSEDPQSLKVGMWAITQWAGNAERYAKAKALPGEGVTTAGEGTYKCNRFAADGFAEGAEMGYAPNGENESYSIGERSGLARAIKGRNGYPNSANELGDPDKEIAHTEVIEEEEMQMGDIISFPYNEGIGHTGLVLTDKMYISARNAADRPGVDIQPYDGVQITKIKNQDKVIRRVDSQVQKSWDSNFSFGARIAKGDTIMNIKSSGDLRMSTRGDYENPSGLAEADNYYEVILHNLDGDVVGPSSIKVPVGSQQQYIWPNITPGQYYLELVKPNSDEPLVGTMHTEIVNEKQGE